MRIEKDVFSGNSYPAVHCGNTYLEERETEVAILMTRPYCETRWEDKRMKRKPGKNFSNISNIKHIFHSYMKGMVSEQWFGVVLNYSPTWNVSGLIQRIICLAFWFKRIISSSVIVQLERSLGLEICTTNLKTKTWGAGEPALSWDIFPNILPSWKYFGQEGGGGNNLWTN